MVKILPASEAALSKHNHRLARHIPEKQIPRSYGAPLSPNGIPDTDQTRRLSVSSLGTLPSLFRTRGRAAAQRPIYVTPDNEEGPDATDTGTTSSAQADLKATTAATAAELTPSSIIGGDDGDAQEESADPFGADKLQDPAKLSAIFAQLVLGDGKSKASEREQDGKEENLCELIALVPLFPDPSQQRLKK